MNTTDLKPWTVEDSAACWVTSLSSRIATKMASSLAWIATMLPVPSGEPFAGDLFGDPRDADNQNRLFLLEVVRSVRAAKATELDAAVKLYCQTRVDAGRPATLAARELLDFRAFIKLAGYLVSWDFKPTFAPVDDSRDLPRCFTLEQIAALPDARRRRLELQARAATILLHLYGIPGTEAAKLDGKDLRKGGVMLHAKTWPEPQPFPLGPNAMETLTALAEMSKRDHAPLFEKTGVALSGKDEPGFDIRAEGPQVQDMARPL